MESQKAAFDHTSDNQVAHDELNSEAVLPRESMHPRGLTEKGKEYRKGLLQRELSRVLKLWRRELENSKSALTDTLDISILQERRSALELCMSELTATHDTLADILNANELSESFKRYKIWYTEHRKMFKMLNDKIFDARSDRDERHSLISSRSRQSHLSGQSSIAKRAEMLTKAARLNTELKFLDVEQDKAAELKKIQLMKEIASNQAEIEAWQN